MFGPSSSMYPVLMSGSRHLREGPKHELTRILESKAGLICPLDMGDVRVRK